MKKLFNIFILILLYFSLSIYAQTTYEGPADGYTSEGIRVSMNTFATSATGGGGKLKLFNKIPGPELLEPPVEMMSRFYNIGQNEIKDPALNAAFNSNNADLAFKVESFDGIPDISSSIPPDPYLAVGTTQIIQTVNSRFRITDKQGNTLKTANADDFFASLNIPSTSAFDPKVVFDHFDNRWIMLWDQVDDARSDAYLFLGVSVTDDAMGDWYIWALPATVNGTTPDGRWCDYPGIGYDDKAIYINGNYFSFTNGGTTSVKLKILLKEEIYANTGAALVYRDFWDIKYPGVSASAWGIRPARMISASSEYYLISSGRYSTNNDIAIYTVSEDLSTLDGFTVPVTTYRSAPNANQLGGGALLLETGGANFRNEPVYQNGILHAVHSVAGGTGNAYGYLRYLAIDIAAKSAVVDFAMGEDDYWYSYPALAVDPDDNVFFGYSRSASTEYIGAYYTSLKAGSDTPAGSGVLQTGKGNYVRDYSSGRNRWGDYNGAWTDPADPYTIWVLTEYAAGTNLWGNWVAGMRLTALPGVHSLMEISSLDFGNIEYNFESDVQTVSIQSQGDQPLLINNITLSDPAYVLLNEPNFPVTLNFREELNLEIKFVPADRGVVDASLTLETNDPLNQNYVVTLKGKGYIINPAVDGIIYATSNSQTHGSLLSLHSNLGTGSIIGETGFTEVSSISINPLTNEIIGLNVAGGISNLIRINSQFGDAYLLTEIPMLLKEIEFDDDGTLYGISDANELYTLNSIDGSFTKIGSIDKSVTGIAVNPVDGQLWAAMSENTDKGAIYKVDKTNASYQLVGKSNFNYDINELAFDNSGNLFGLYTEIFILKPSNFISINTADGTGTLIGSIGKKGILGLAIMGDTVTTDIENDITSNIPSEYHLEQNYPNPFNPSTTINFSLPKDSNVKLYIYNLLGELVAKLVDSELKAGNYSVDWNMNNSSTQLSSGIYLYKLEAGEYRATRKMMLLK